MIILGDSKLKWVEFKELPMGCEFINRAKTSVFQKVNNYGYYTEAKLYRPATDTERFAEVVVIEAVIAKSIIPE